MTLLKKFGGDGRMTRVDNRNCRPSQVVLLIPSGVYYIEVQQGL